MHGLHHAHKRKRIHQKLELFPHPHPWKRFLDRAIFVVGICGPISTVPQILKIWVHKDAGAISLITWSVFAFTSFFWMLYGISHRDRPITVIFTAAFVLNIVIVIGTILY